MRTVYREASTQALIPSRQYLLMNQDKGRIEDVARKKAKNGTPYASVRIDGENYTCWDDALISKLESGQDVDYQWEQSGKFKKIIDIEPVLDDLDLTPKDLRILRMSALRSASYLEIGLDVPLEEKLGTTLETSRAFERYILGRAEQVE